MPVILSGECPRPLQTVQFHTHSTWEIILNLEGCGNDIIGETESSFSPGTIICVPPHIKHSKVSMDRFKDIYIQSTEFFGGNRPEALCFHDDEDKNIEALMQLACNAFNKHNKNSSIIADSLYDAIQVILHNMMKSPAKNQCTEQLQKLIMDNFSDPEFDVSAAIATLPYCRDYIRRLFRNETGLTPVAYLNKVRLEHAKRLLKHWTAAGYTIGELAWQCGFYDSKYFTRLFKRYTAQSPMQFAREMIG